MIPLRELRERKLVQWSLAYAAGAWALLQVLDLLIATFGWPIGLQRGAIVVLAIGFFAVFVVAWYHGEKGAQRVSGIEISMLTGILVIAGAAVAWVGGPVRVAEPPEVTADVLEPTAEQSSIAVLPFVNMSSDPEQEYFSDGLTEELLNVLAQLPELRVAARTSSFSFKGTNVPVDSIGRVLNVAHVLEGSVRRNGEQIRITAQLIDTRTGYHLWSHTYDRELRDVFAVQDEISRAIVRQLELELSGGRQSGVLAKEETSDAQAHALVLRGDYIARQLTPEALRQATGLFREAIARDPGFARAYARLANVRMLQSITRSVPDASGLDEARALAEKSLEIDPDLVPGHEMVGRLLTDRGEYAAAESHFRRALELSPHDVNTLSGLSILFLRQWRVEDALLPARRAAELDPASPRAVHSLGLALAYAGRDAEAVEQFEALRGLVPDRAFPLIELAYSYPLLGRHAEAIEAAEAARAIEPDNPSTFTVLAYTYGMAGRRADALAAIRTLEAMDPPDYLLANAYMGAGDSERTLHHLERALESGLTDLLPIDPTFKPLHGDPRMQRLIARVRADAGSP